MTLNKMKIIDEVYGDEEINELVLADLINSKSIQRLNNISQYGVPDEYYHKKGFSRYEHSIGVLILLRKIGASLDEQIAGLLHDVSHTTFSHVIDLLVEDPIKEDYQDRIHFEILKNSEIPEILEKYRVNYIDISKLENFSLLEQDSPKPCADRIDYTLRELKMENKFDEIRKILDGLGVFDNQIVFFEKNPAIIFAENYMRLQEDYWSEDQARMRYYILSNILKIAINNKIISFDDLRSTDSEVINLLLESGHQDILNQLNLLKKGFKIIESSNGILIKKKFRYIDLAILIENKIRCLTEVSNEYFEKINKAKFNSDFFKKIMVVEY